MVVPLFDLQQYANTSPTRTPLNYLCSHEQKLTFLGPANWPDFWHINPENSNLTIDQE
jgi:hypothetical protein